MFSVKTSTILKSITAGADGAAASADASNDKAFARFAAKAKVPQALVKAAFTHAGLNNPDGTFAFATKDMDQLKSYVSRKVTNRDLKPEDQARLLKVLDTFVAAVQVRLSASQASAYGRAPSRTRQPSAHNLTSPLPQAPASQQAPGTQGHRASDEQLKGILRHVIEADAANTSMQGTTERRAFPAAKRQAQKLYRQAARELAAYIRQAPSGLDKARALAHQGRVLAQLEAVNHATLAP